MKLPNEFNPSEITVSVAFTMTEELVENGFSISSGPAEVYLRDQSGDTLAVMGWEQLSRKYFVRVPDPIRSEEYVDSWSGFELRDAIVRFGYVIGAGITSKTFADAMTFEIR